jgi:hypothetical protein
MDVDFFVRSANQISVAIEMIHGQGRKCFSLLGQNDLRDS